MSMRRRRLVLGLTALASLLLLLAVALHRRGSDAEGAGASAEGEAGSRQPPRSALRPIAVRPGSDRGAAPEQVSRTEPPAAATAAQAAGGPPDMTGAPAGGSGLLPTELVDNGPGRRYLERYAGQSGRLPQGMPPADRYAPKKMTFSRVPLTIWADDDTLDPGDRATIHVEADENVEIAEAVATFTGQHGTRRAAMRAAGTREVRVEFVAQPADYEGAERPGQPLSVDAVAQVTYVEKGERKTALVSTMLFLQKSGARIVAGSQRIERSGEGNAVLSFEVDVSVAGRYHAAAELWAVASERSIAFGRNHLGELTPGRHRVSLLFGGAVIRDSQLDGPYAVRSLELNRVDTIPPHTAQPIAEVLRTPGWRAADFF